MTTTRREAPEKIWLDPDDDAQIRCAYLDRDDMADEVVAESAVEYTRSDLFPASVEGDVVAKCLALADKAEAFALFLAIDGAYNHHPQASDYVELAQAIRLLAERHVPPGEKS